MSDDVILGVSWSNKFETEQKSNAGDWREKEKVAVLPLETHEEIWSASQCAAYTGYSKAHFKNKISKLPDFPKSVRWLPRWVRSEVVAWAIKR